MKLLDLLDTALDAALRCPTKPVRAAAVGCVVGVAAFVLGLIPSCLWFLVLEPIAAINFVLWSSAACAIGTGLVNGVATWVRT
jgi:hypothetical protein